MIGPEILIEGQPWQPQFVGTLMFLRRENQVLLIHKLTGHGAGRINGPGGKLDPGETTLQCAIRETAEEVGVTVQEAHCLCEMRFVELDGPQWLGFAFVSEKFPGAAQATAEADPFWVNIDTIPYERMWPDDRIWLPRILSMPLNAPALVANFTFKNEHLLRHEFVDEPSLWRMDPGMFKRV